MDCLGTYNIITEKIKVILASSSDLRYFALGDNDKNFPRPNFYLSVEIGSSYCMSKKACSFTYRDYTILNIL